MPKRPLPYDSKTLLDSRIWQGMTIVDHRLNPSNNISVTIAYDHHRVTATFDPSMTIPEDSLAHLGYECAYSFVGHGPVWEDWNARHSRDLMVVHFCRRIRGQFRSLISTDYPQIAHIIEGRGAERVIRKALIKALEHLPANKIYQILDSLTIQNVMKQ